MLYLNINKWQEWKEMEQNIKNKYQNKENTIFDIDKLIKRLIFVLKIKEWKINDQV